MPNSLTRSVAPYETTPKMPRHAMSKVSKPMPTAMPLAMRVPATRRSNDIAQQPDTRQDARIERRGFSQHGRERRGIATGARNQDRLHVFGGRQRPIQLGGVDRLDPDGMGVAGDADDRGLRFRSRKPASQHVHRSIHRHRQCPADDDGRRRIVAGAEMSVRARAGSPSPRRTPARCCSIPRPGRVHRRRCWRGPGRRAAARARARAPRFPGCCSTRALTVFQ